RKSVDLDDYFLTWNKIYASSKDHLDLNNAPNIVTNGFIVAKNLKLRPNDIVVFDEIHEYDEDAFILLDRYKGQVVLLSATPIPRECDLVIDTGLDIDKHNSKHIMCHSSHSVAIQCQGRTGRTCNDIYIRLYQNYIDNLFDVSISFIYNYLHLYEKFWQVKPSYYSAKKLINPKIPSCFNSLIQSNLDYDVYLELIYTTNQQDADLLYQHLLAKHYNAYTYYFENINITTSIEDIWIGLNNFNILPRLIQYNTIRYDSQLKLFYFHYSHQNSLARYLYVQTNRTKMYIKDVAKLLFKYPTKKNVMNEANKSLQGTFIFGKMYKESKNKKKQKIYTNKYLNDLNNLHDKIVSGAILSQKESDLVYDINQQYIKYKENNPDFNLLAASDFLPPKQYKFIKENPQNKKHLKEYYQKILDDLVNKVNKDKLLINIDHKRQAEATKRINELLDEAFEEDKKNIFKNFNKPDYAKQKEAESIYTFELGQKNLNKSSEPFIYLDFARCVLGQQSLPLLKTAYMDSCVKCDYNMLQDVCYKCIKESNYTVSYAWCRLKDSLVEMRELAKYLYRKNNSFYIHHKGAEHIISNGLAPYEYYIVNDTIY
ncbi:21559_t:CDS:2, partial [Dentiscutata erythropus]